MVTKVVIFSSCDILNATETQMNIPNFLHKFLASDYQMVTQLVIISSCLKRLFSSKMSPCISDHFAITEMLRNGNGNAPKSAMLNLLLV